MLQFSLREFLIVSIGASAAFAAGFLPIRSEGGVTGLIAGASALAGICCIVVFSIHRGAIATGLVCTFAATLGTMLAIPHDQWDMGLVLFLALVFAFPIAFVTVPLTISRLMRTTKL